MVGIYKITNPDGRVYIGKSCDIGKRFYQYSLLSCKNQTKLYNSFKKYGFDKHGKEVLAVCDNKELSAMELYFINKYDSINNGLNTQKVKYKKDIDMNRTKMLGVRLSVNEFNIIGILRSRKINVAQFVRDAILEKISRDIKDL